MRIEFTRLKRKNMKTIISDFDNRSIAIRGEIDLAMCLIETIEDDYTIH
jgi:predicted HAD superfamily phosphohydrolase YqeG